MIAAPTARHPAITNKPMLVLLVRSLIHPTMKGLTKPARLPTELINAMPAAAAAPLKKAGGRHQNCARPVMMPIVAIVSVTIAQNGVCGTRVLAMSPTAPTTAGIAICQRR